MVGKEIRMERVMERNIKKTAMVPLIRESDRKLYFHQTHDLVNRNGCGNNEHNHR